MHYCHLIKYISLHSYKAQLFDFVLLYLYLHLHIGCDYSGIFVQCAIFHYIYPILNIVMYSTDFFSVAGSHFKGDTTADKYLKYSVAV